MKVVSEQLSYFQSHFYLLYFQILNRFIRRDGAKFTDAEVREVLDGVAKEDVFYRDNVRRIQKDDRSLQRYARGRVWYVKNFGKPDFWEKKERSRCLWRMAFFFWNIRARRRGENGC